MTFSAVVSSRPAALSLRHRRCNLHIAESDPPHPTVRPGTKSPMLHVREINEFADLAACRLLWQSLLA
ncbi:MAG TPA: hypothetical protein VHB99_01360, partial [Pirellulales bacterium]|nr:hypothetical protein [Pirellulales bacterium]